MEEKTTQAGGNPVEILDGGMGEELIKLGLPYDKIHWTANALMEKKYHPLIKKVHQSFLEVGSSYITTANYPVTPGCQLEARISELVPLAGLMAKEALNEYHGESSHIKICGSLPPLMESYRADLVLPPEKSIPIYQKIIQGLEPYVDIYLAETMSSLEESLMVVESIKRSQTSKELWVSWTLNDQGKLRSNESVISSIEKIVSTHESAGIKNLRGILFNCSLPESITLALKEIQKNKKVGKLLQEKDIFLGAYANRLISVPEDFEMSATENPTQFREDLSIQNYISYVKEWVTLGATKVGGCCGIGPDYIKAIASELTSFTS